jgi:hypothetical protein
MYQQTEQEWEEFSHHFRHRKMALGECYRPYGTPCPHEHACVRCHMLRMDPVQPPRLLQIEENTMPVAQLTCAAPCHRAGGGH